MHTGPYLCIALKPQYGRTPVEYSELTVQVWFTHSLLRFRWLWVKDNSCLLWHYLCLFYPKNTSCLCRGATTNIDFVIDVKNIIVGQRLILLETSFIRGFLQLPLWCPLGSNLCKHAGGHSVTTESCTSLAYVCVVCMSGSSLELSALWHHQLPPVHA